MKDNVTAAKEYTEWHIKTGGHLDSMTMRDYFAGLAMQNFFLMLLQQESMHRRTMSLQGSLTKWQRPCSRSVPNERFLR